MRFAAAPPISRTMTARRLLVSVVIGASVFGAGGVLADDPLHGAETPAPPEPLYRRFKASIGFHYSSGDYGSSDTTEIFYVPLVLTAEVSRFTLQATIPYLRVEGPSQAIVEGPEGPIAGNGDGLGDVLARASYLLPRKHEWPVWVPFVDLVGLVKFPTASRGDGLGTGEFDLGLDAELTWVAGRLTPFAAVGYRFLGDPPGFDLHDVFAASAGAMVRIIDTLGAGVLLDYREASSSSTGERLEIVPFASWKLLGHWSADPYVSAGLAKGSPDAGVGVQFGCAW